MNPPLPDGLPPLKFLKDAWSMSPTLPVDQCWKCPDCESWATLSENAGYHMRKSGHGLPVPAPIVLSPALPLPEEDAKTEGEVHKVWVAISNTNGCALTVDDSDHSADIWPGATWNCFVHESCLAESKAEVERLKRDNDDLDSSLSSVIQERERATDFADHFAGKVSEITGIDIGEHSNLNCPWEEALDALDELTSLREENKRLREWHPIRTAPKDGARILLAIQWDEIPVVGWWDGKCWDVDTTHYDCDTGAWGNGGIVTRNIEDRFVTHWRPLPAAPENQGEGGEG